MLRSDGLRVAGKVYAFYSVRDGLIVKVPAARAAALVADGTAEQVRMGERRMKEWIELREPVEEVWRALMDEAAGYVGTLSSTK